MVWNAHRCLRFDPGQDPTMRLMLFATRDDVTLLDLRSFADDVLEPELSKIDRCGRCQGFPAAPSDRCAFHFASAT